MSVFIMFASYILHEWAMPFMRRDAVPQAFFDIVNADEADVCTPARSERRLCVGVPATSGCRAKRCPGRRGGGSPVWCACVACLQRREPKVVRMIALSKSRLVRYVFNYNTLEGVSIVVSTIILLAGMVRPR